MTDSDAEALVRHIVTRDASTPVVALQRLGDHRTQALMATALAVAVDRKFPGDLTEDVIGSFIADLKRRFPQNADEINPSVVRALLLTVDGQPGLLDPYARDELMSMEYLITYAIISEQLLDEEQLQAYIAEVVATVDAQP